MVQLKMLTSKSSVCCHISGVYLRPFVMTRFSRQLIDDRASCSFSENDSFVNDFNTNRHTYLAVHTNATDHRYSVILTCTAYHNTARIHRPLHIVHDCMSSSSIQLSATKKMKYDRYTEE